MTRRSLTGLLVLLAAATVAMPALAGPCERMSGARWVVYFERDWMGVRNMSTGSIDFRSTLIGAPAFFARGPTNAPNGYPHNASSPRQHGEAEMRGASCVNQTEPVAVISLNLTDAFRVSVAPDGRSGLVMSDQGVQIGWAERLPTPPPSPTRTR